MCVCTKSLQSCLTLCNPMDCTLPYSSVHGILQARILEWVAMLSSRGIFLTQGSNSSLLRLLHWQVGSLPLGPPGKPKYHLKSLEEKEREREREEEKCWSVSLTNHVQNLCAKNYTPLTRDIKDHLSQWRNRPCSWTERQCSRTSITPTWNEGLNKFQSELQHDILYTQTAYTEMQMKRQRN